MKLKQKQKLNTRGFTLTEVLMTVLILALAAGVVSAGMPVAINAYKEVSSKSESQVFLSTCLSEIKSQLSMATEVSVSENIISFTDSAAGSSSKLYLGSDGVYIKKESSAPELLVSSEAVSGAVFSWESVSCSGGIVTISDISVVKGETEIASLDEFVIRTADYR